ncbi:adventurous gliding motility protein AgmC [Stigmatella hybrida]|uniref:adventurous gliding motility protein AgmC n=1 Tax=Stigmatella hybrida TaxID=394097 RepID=UPI001CDB0805|nr:hemagglutinin [Stigmatella hybrida]
MRMVLFWLGLLVAQRVLAEPDTFGFGSGRSGSLSVKDTDSAVINRYSPLSTPVAAGARELAVADAAGFTAGELVLLHASSGLTPAPDSGAQAPLALSGGPVGQYEFARVESVSAAAVRLTAPLLHGYPAPGTQVVSVPEYTQVQVGERASLRAAPWDGQVGGLLVFLVTGTLSNAGTVTVAGLGFRGGSMFNHARWTGCSDVDVPVTRGGSYKGEGLVAERFGVASGRGNLANGGGGGNCHNAGGGGGGHGGVGGPGGRSAVVDGARAVGGLGGAAVVYSPFERLVFGGGGGEGEGNNTFGTAGGAGGGAMLIRAGQVQGPGRFLANGSAAAATRLGGDDGAGGGGAGGAVSLRSGGALACGGVEASGGQGGDTTHATEETGPGGGGAGGVILLQGTPLACPASARAGAAGTWRIQNDSRGAGPVAGQDAPSQGLLRSVSFPVGPLAPPVLSQPLSGARGVASRPLFEGTAAPGAHVSLVLDGQPLAEVQLEEAQERFAYEAPTDLSPGAHEVRVSASWQGLFSALSAPVLFEVGGENAGAPAVVMVVPVEGARVEPTPLLAGKSPPDARVSVEVDTVEVAQVSADAEGRFRYVLSAEQALAPGMHQVSARVLDTQEGEALRSQVTAFEVVEPRELDAGCGCGAGPAGGLGGLAGLLGLWAARGRARAPGRRPPGGHLRSPGPRESRATPASR